MEPKSIAVGSTRVVRIHFRIRPLSRYDPNTMVSVGRLSRFIRSRLVSFRLRRSNSQDLAPEGVAIMSESV